MLRVVGSCEWVSGGGDNFGGGEGEGDGEQCDWKGMGRGRAEDWGEERKGRWRWKRVAIWTNSGFERTDAGGHVPCEIEGERCYVAGRWEG